MASDNDIFEASLTISNIDDDMLNQLLEQSHESSFFARTEWLAIKYIQPEDVFDEYEKVVNGSSGLKLLDALLSSASGGWYFSAISVFGNSILGPYKDALNRAQHTGKGVLIQKRMNYTISFNPNTAIDISFNNRQKINGINADRLKNDKERYCP